MTFYVRKYSCDENYSLFTLDVPYNAHVFSRLSAGHVTWGVGILLEVVHEDIAVSEADTDHVGVLGVEVEAGHGGGRPALVFGPGRVLQGEDTHHPLHKSVLEVI